MIGKEQWRWIGMSQMIDDIDLRSCLNIENETRTHEYICDCVFCGKERHMYVNKDTQLWGCKKCGESGNIYKLLVQVGKTYLLKGKTVENKEIIDSVRSIKSDGEEEMVEVKPLPVIKMPAGWKVLKKSNSYLLSRNISPELCEYYNFGETKLMNKFKDYVLIPIYDKKLIRGFVGRYGNKNVPKNKLRYNNSIGTQFSQLLYGYDEIKKGVTRSVVIVEGIFDKIAVDNVLRLRECDDMKCVASFGKKISDYQIQKLKNKDIANVILLYDFDAVKDIRKYGLELDKTFQTVITFTNKKDIDECTQAEAIEVFKHLRKPREFAVDIIAKLKR